MPALSFIVFLQLQMFVDRMGDGEQDGDGGRNKKAGSCLALCQLQIPGTGCLRERIRALLGASHETCSRWTLWDGGGKRHFWTINVLLLNKNHLKVLYPPLQQYSNASANVGGSDVTML